jgi:pyridoxine/pyridoxamine 5'-phosphate oxidase
MSPRRRARSLQRLSKERTVQNAALTELLPMREWRQRAMQDSLTEGQAIIIAIVTPNPMGQSAVECYWLKDQNEVKAVLEQQIGHPGIVILGKVDYSKAGGQIEAMLVPQSTIAGWTEEARRRLTDSVLQSMTRFYSDVTGKNLVEKKAVDA